MARIIRCGLIQATNVEPADQPIEKIKKAMIDKHIAMIEDAAKKGVQIICLQELFYGPYFPAEQNPHWYDLVERIRTRSVDVFKSGSHSSLPANASPIAVRDRCHRSRPDDDSTRLYRDLAGKAGDPQAAYS